MTALKLFSLMTILTGLVYPVLVTVGARALFAVRAGGEPVSRAGHVVGARLIGQKFASPRYFWGRPSGVGYDAQASGGSNLGPTSAALVKAVEERAAVLRSAHGLSAPAPVPPDLLFASASGLDPEISPAAAHFQVKRVVAARGLVGEKAGLLTELIRRETRAPELGFLGEPRVNVLELNLAVDAAL